MEEKKEAGRIRVAYRRSKPLTKVVVIAAIVLFTAALIALRLTQNEILADIQKMREEAAYLEQENQELREDIDALGSVQSVEEIAREELGLVDPDTVIVDPE